MDAVGYGVGWGGVASQRTQRRASEHFGQRAFRPARLTAIEPTASERDGEARPTASESTALRSDEAPGPASEFNGQRALQPASPTATEPYEPDDERERPAQQPTRPTDSEPYGQQTPTTNPTARPLALVLLLLLFR